MPASCLAPTSHRTAGYAAQAPIPTIPGFHAVAHARECCLRLHNPTSQASFRLDGEGIEQMWPSVLPDGTDPGFRTEAEPIEHAWAELAPSVPHREMPVGSRQEMLDGVFSFAHKATTPGKHPRDEEDSGVVCAMKKSCK
ncbi:hypothetical protein C8R44DRAFT_733330 [Mycena epipterygia]|nr:hypothetical protein C8R44DRAFT_733330 [Mycena epipterygia]